MRARRGFEIVCLTALMASCGVVESSKEKSLKKSNKNLRQENKELKGQLDTLGHDGAGLRDIEANIVRLNNELEASRLTQERLLQEKVILEQSIADLSTGDHAARILELRRRLSETEARLSEEQRNFAKLSSGIQYFDSLIKNTLEPFWGLYINRGEAIRIGSTPCRLFVYAENNGIMTRALACQDLRIQWERQAMRSFDSVVDERLEGKYGFGIKGEVVESSCTNANATSFAVTNGDYHFERAGRYGDAVFSVAVRTEFNGQVTLDNAAVTYTSNDCEDLITRAEAGDAALYTPQAKETLDLAARFCRFVRGEKNFLETCFTSNN